MPGGNVMLVISTKSPVQFEREQYRRHSAVPELWAVLDRVCDPEIPVLSLWDLGVLKDIRWLGEQVTVIITPTYSGCPAMDVMSEDIHHALVSFGIQKVSVVVELSPAWTTDWMTSRGREHLRGFGIAAPDDVVATESNIIDENTRAICPHCSADDTSLISEFGSTSCKALFKCHGCLEPFDLFKHI